MTDPTENPARTTAAAPSTSLPQRYGAGRSRRRTPIVLGAIFVAALLTWALWATWETERRAIDASVTAYEVVDSHEVRVQVTAHVRDDEVQGSCLLRATAADHTVVGERNLTVAELRAAAGQWIAVRTERRATTAALVRCTG